MFPRKHDFLTTNEMESFEANIDNNYLVYQLSKVKKNDSIFFSQLLFTKNRNYKNSTLPEEFHQ